MNYDEVLQVFREEAQEIKDFCAQAKCTSDRDKKLLEAFEVVDKVLKAEPCEDAVSRSAIMKLQQAYRDECGYIVDNVVSVNLVRNLPSVTSKQRWIPVSEKLPEETGMYLVTYQREFIPDHIDEINHVTDIDKKYYSEEFGWDAREVKAWMPLPTPYKEGKKE